MKPDQTLDLPELARLAGVSTRTVRFYIQQGLLPAPESRGPGARYSDEHLDRLRLIKHLQREHLPLAEIRRRLDVLRPAEIARLAAERPAKRRSSAGDYIRDVLRERAPRENAPSFRLTSDAFADAGDIGPPMSAVSASLVSSPTDASHASKPTRSQWDRITLAPDVELHVRRPLSREQNRQLERLVEAARRIFEEDDAP